jgi:hypothetical protein
MRVSIFFAEEFEDTKGAIRIRIISQSTVTIHDQQHHAEIVNTLGNCFTPRF